MVHFRRSAVFFFQFNILEMWCGAYVHFAQRKWRLRQFKVKHPLLSNSQRDHFRQLKNNDIRMNMKFQIILVFSIFKCKKKRNFFCCNTQIKLNLGAETRRVSLLSTYGHLVIKHFPLHLSNLRLLDVSPTFAVIFSSVLVSTNSWVKHMCHYTLMKAPPCSPANR